MTKPVDVVVVGAGPVGLSVGLGVARAGYKVTILEKNPSTSERSRAPAIWPRTQEILHGLGVIDTFLDEGIIIHDFRPWDADKKRVLIHLPFHELKDETDFPQFLIVPQSTTERILREAVGQLPNATIHFNAEVHNIDLQAGSVTIAYRENGSENIVNAKFVAACDGAHSTVRECLGLSLEGITYPITAALADVIIDPNPDVPFPRITTQGGMAVGIRMTPSLWRLIIPFVSEDEIDQRVEKAVRALFDTDRYSLDWKSHFNLHRRISPQFVRGRVALAGDAAHLNSPVGGQGMNAGIQDAEVLVEALLKCIEADNAGLLRDYETTRRPIIERDVNLLTDRLTRALLLSRYTGIRPLFHLMRAATCIPLVRKIVMRRMAMLAPLRKTA